MTRLDQRVWRGCAMSICAVALLLATDVRAQDDGQQDAGADVPTIQDGQQLIQAQDWAGAATVFRAIIKDQPENGTAWHLLGYALHGQGKLYEALPCHLMAAELPGGGATSMYNVACVYSIQKKTEKAFEWLGKAQNAGFRNPQQLRTDPDMDNIREDPRFEQILKTMRVQAPGSGINATPFIDAPLTRSGNEYADRPPQRQLDFWVGDWEVHTPTGQKAGMNHIELSLQDNMILEHWTSATGGQGKSVNYYDRAAKQWVQVWVDGSGGVITKRGSFKDGAMRMTGEHILPDGATRAFRSTLTPLEDGRVRQFIEESTDGGETWSTWFEGFYVRTDTAKDGG